MQIRKASVFLAPVVGLFLLSGGAVPLWGQGTLFVTGDRVGVGIDVPEQMLHVKSTTGAAQILVEESAAGEHFLFALENPGKTRFKINNTTAGAWTFDVDNAARFAISRLGTGANELLIDSVGNGTFRGNVVANGVLLTSSRQSKEAIGPLDAGQLLDRLMEVPILEWQYKDDALETRHLGPMAEDFQQAFGLSDGRHLSVIDVQGVALAAIQGLNSKLEAENRELRTELAQLRSAVEQLQASRR